MTMFPSSLHPQTSPWRDASPLQRSIATRIWDSHFAAIHGHPPSSPNHLSQQSTLLQESFLIQAHAIIREVLAEYPPARS